MRITHVSLQHCRLHTSMRHELSPGLNLIAGDNESGKSTLVEAIHRALFLKAKGTSAHHKALVPTTGGMPEVELGIEAAGRRFVLRKRFGSNGSTTFAAQDAAPLVGPEAEAALEALVGPPAGGQQLDERWAHLWVWQGDSIQDPSGHATTQRDQLLASLQALGGAALLQSESDTRLAQQFADEAQRWFVTAGRARADSGLGRALKSVEQAEEQHRTAETRWNRLQSAHHEHESAQQAIAWATQALASLQAEETACTARLAELTELRSREANETHRKTTAETALEAARAMEQRIREISDQVNTLQGEAASRGRRLNEVRSSAQAARAALALAEEQLLSAEALARQSQALGEITSKEVETLEISAQLDLIRARSAKAQSLQSEIAGKNHALTTLPAISRAALRKLMSRESELGAAKAAVQAMATGLTVIETSTPVRIGDELLHSGQSTTLTAETLVQVGDGVRFRIQPGGGATLEDTRAQARDLEAGIQDELRRLGLRTVPEAEEAFGRRNELEQHLEVLQGRLAELGPERLAQECASLEARLSEASAHLARLVSLAGIELPTRTLDEARNHHSRWKTHHDALEGAVRGARSARERAVAQREEYDTKERDLGREDDEQRGCLSALQGQMDLLVRDHGDVANRALRLGQAQAELTAAEAGLRSTRAAIERLEPDHLKADVERLQRVRTEQSNLLAQSRERAAAARGTLTADGVSDPAADLSSATRQLEQARQWATEQHRHASAIALLDQLFQEEQRHLSTQFTRPLAERLNGYLRCLFGPRAEAQVDLHQGEFQGLRLLRPEEGPAPLPFDVLSGGAREQVAAALRLAVAELLASGGDGCLPVVFDDAFAFSDSNRVRGMHRMLDLAARQGLQILVMTCHPAHYTGLGARQILLTRALGAPVPRPADPAGGLRVGPMDPEEPEDVEKTRAPRSIVEPPPAGSNHPAGAHETDRPAPAPVRASAAGPAIGLSDGVTAEAAVATSGTTIPPAMSSANEARLLEVLATRGGSSGNQTLRNALGWSEAEYDAVKSSLVARGHLIPGRGRGGSVALRAA